MAVYTVSVCVLCFCVCVCFILLLCPVGQSWVCKHAADVETGFKDSTVLNGNGLASLAARDKWTKVDIICRCDIVPIKVMGW